MSVCGVVCRIPTFQPRRSEFDSWRVRKFNLYLDVRCVPLSVFCPVLSLEKALTFADDRFQGSPAL